MVVATVEIDEAVTQLDEQARGVHDVGEQHRQHP
jgi:hypothetical protein